jgi:hypothetical protein
MNSILSTLDGPKEHSGANGPTVIQPLPLRFSLQCLFLGCGVITTIVGWTIYKSRATFPPWFCPVAMLSLTVFLAIIAGYIWTIRRVKMPLHPPGTREAVLLWTLLVLSVICTSSLHGFAPFHLHILTEYSQLPSSLRFIRYNHILTGCSLLAIVSLATSFFRGQQRRALAGLVVLVGVMLIPNDDCTNAFNHPWLGWLGASPLMFLGNAVVLLIGYCGLNGLRPRLSALLMGLIECGVLLLGLGHQSKLIW